MSECLEFRNLVATPWTMHDRLPAHSAPPHLCKLENLQQHGGAIDHGNRIPLVLLSSWRLGPQRQAQRQKFLQERVGQRDPEGTLSIDRILQAIAFLSPAVALHPPHAEGRLPAWHRPPARPLAFVPSSPSSGRTRAGQVWRPAPACSGCARWGSSPTAPTQSRIPPFWRHLRGCRSPPGLASAALFGWQRRRICRRSNRLSSRTHIHRFPIPSLPCGSWSSCTVCGSEGSSTCRWH